VIAREVAPDECDSYQRKEEGVDRLPHPPIATRMRRSRLQAALIDEDQDRAHRDHLGSAQMRMSPVTTLFVATALGIAAAVAVVVFHSVVADVVGGVVALAALAAVIRAAIQLAGEFGAPPDDPVSRRP
jgi:hypothetical protein